MPLSIQVPTESSYTEQVIELGGLQYKFIYKLNERFSPARLYLDIIYGDSLVKSGMKLLENSELTDRYILENFEHGALYLIKLGKTSQTSTLGNIGIGLSFGLVYYANDELTEAIDE